MPISIFGPNCFLFLIETIHVLWSLISQSSLNTIQKNVELSQFFYVHGVYSSDVLSFTRDIWIIFDPDDCIALTNAFAFLERLVEAFLEMLFLKGLYVSNKIFSLFGQYCVIMFLIVSFTIHSLFHWSQAGWGVELTVS